MQNLLSRSFREYVIYDLIHAVIDNVTHVGIAIVTYSRNNLDNKFCRYGLYTTTHELDRVLLFAIIFVGRIIQ